MVNANELRIGNYVLGEGLECRITAHDIYMMDSGKLISEPIPLTPEILEKCGFRNPEYRIYKNGDFEFYSDHTTGTCLYPGPPYETATKFKYLHQLQNLYFQLMGKELQYKHETVLVQ